MHKTSLLIVAHGSRRAESNLEIQQLAASIAEIAIKDYFSIDYAFLELAEPSISDIIDKYWHNGVQHIVLVPYFLSAGRHVQQDIPQQISAKQAQYPDLKITIINHLGAAPEMANLVLSMVKKYD